jgi:potassium voltage-gated channel Shaw-related subfamily C member 1
MISGSSLYYVERLSNPSENQLPSVMDGLWLALGTIGTIGYGDVVPKSFLGMILGAITTVAGVLIIDLPMPIIVEIFTNFYGHLQARQQLPKKRRRTTPAVVPRKIQPLMPPNGHSQKE